MLRAKTTLFCALLQEIFTIRCAKRCFARVQAAPNRCGSNLSGVNLRNLVISVQKQLRKEGKQPLNHEKFEGAS